MEHVFGYGSLTAARPPALRAATLRGYRRVWGTAMDNRRAIPGYKVYEDDAGRRPAVDVVFLDVVPDPRAAVNGALLAVDGAALAALDVRERQYERVDVTEHVDPAPGGTVWTYQGHAEARRRVREGSPVVARDYLEAVERAFAARGELEAFRAGTEPPAFPVADLRRVLL